MAPELGSLLVAAGSHRLPAFSALRAGYGRTQVGGPPASFIGLLLISVMPLQGRALPPSLGRLQKTITMEP